MIAKIGKIAKAVFCSILPLDKWDNTTNSIAEESLEYLSDNEGIAPKLHDDLEEKYFEYNDRKK